MKRTTVFLVIFTTSILFLIVLFGVNRDLFQYSLDQPLKRTFLPDLDPKNDYLLTEPIALKPGSYVFAPEMTVKGSGSGIFFIDGNDREIFYRDLPDGTADPSFPLEITETPRQVRLGIRYDPEGSAVELTRIKISADHILYRESLLRHLVMTFLLILICLWIIIRICFPERLWKLFPKMADRRNELALLLMLGLTAAACFPLFNGKTYVHGEDMFFHLTRIRGLADSLQAGYFPVRDQLYWLHNYGYGVGFYYPDVFLYFPALLVIFGFDLLSSYKIFLTVCTFLSILSVWYAGLRISRNRITADAAAVFMAFCSYRLSNVYYRGALGETQAAVFYPLIILGAYEIFYGKIKRWPLFAFGFFGLISCHIISLTMAVVLVFLFLLTRIPKIIRKPEIIIVLLRSVLLTAGLSAFFWLPMFEQSLTNPGLRINNVLSGDVMFNGTNYAFPAENLLSRFKAWNFAWQADCIYPGWSLLLVPVLRLFVGRKRSKNIRTADFMLLFSLPVIWMCTRAFPWQWKIFMPFVTRIQFAYRLLLPASTLLCLSGAVYFSELTAERKPVLTLGLLILFCFFSTAFPVLEESVLNRTVPKRTFIMQDNRTSGGEYLPVGLDNDYPGKNADKVSLAEKDIPLTVTSHKRRDLSFRFSFELPEGTGEVHFSVPLIYYTGYSAELADEEGVVRKPAVGWDEKGLVSVSSLGAAHGTVTVTYRKTAVQRAGESLTVLTVILWAVYRKRKCVSGIWF